MKKLHITLIIVFIISILTIPAYAAPFLQEEAADALNQMGLFNGTGTDKYGDPIYDLDREPTRHEAITMLVRLLGKEEEALNGTWETPFTDVIEWAKPYVGYACTNGLTNGTSDTTFGGDNTISATQYLTFILRVLGYKDGTDFKWDAAWKLTDQLGITSGEYTDSSKTFLRGDVALISYNALSATVNGTTATLSQELNLKLRVIPLTMNRCFSRYVIINDQKLKFEPMSLIGYEINNELYIDSEYLRELLIAISGDYYTDHSEILYEAKNKIEYELTDEIAVGYEYAAFSYIRWMKDTATSYQIFNRFSPTGDFDNPQNYIELCQAGFDAPDSEYIIEYQNEVRYVLMGGRHYVNINDIVLFMNMSANVEYINDENIEPAWIIN